MISAVMITKPFLRSLSKMVEERQIAITKAINTSAVNYRNAIVLGMRQTKRRASPVSALDAAKAIVAPTSATPTKKKTKAKKKRTRKIHIPSAPGNPPAPDTGLLVNSIRVDFAKKKDDGQFEVTATIGTNVKYAPLLEYQKNRPVWRPVWNAQVEEIKKRIADAQNGKR